MNYTGRRALSDLECEQFMNALRGRYRLRDRAMFELMRRTGFRVSEILSLRIGDVFEGDTRQTKDSVTVTKRHMKGRRESRTMPLHPNARDALMRYIGDAQLNSPKLAHRPLFPRQGTHKSLGRHQVLHILHNAANCAGIDPSRLGTHSLRKTFASAVYSSPHVNGDLAKMARLLGHRNPANTLRYVEFLDRSLETAVLES